MKLKKKTSQGQAQDDQKLGQARQTKKVHGLKIESEQDAEPLKDVKDIKDEKKDKEGQHYEEEPRWDSRAWYWTAFDRSSGSSGSSGSAAAPREPLPPFNFTQQRMAARVPSQGLVDFLEAMVDLVYQYNLNYDHWLQETLNTIQQIPTEFANTLGNPVFHCVTNIHWRYFIAAITTYGPFSEQVPCFQLIYELVCFLFWKLLTAAGLEQMDSN